MRDRDWMFGQNWVEQTKRALDRQTRTTLGELTGEFDVNANRILRSLGYMTGNDLWLTRANEYRISTQRVR